MAYNINVKLYCLLYTENRCSGHSVLDVVFVIDTSGSIGFSNFQMIREFTANVTTELIHNSPKSSIGMILFDDTARIEFNLQAYSSLRTILSAINQLAYSGRETNMAGALRLLLSTAQNGVLGLRSDSLKLAIIITDGRSGNPSATLSAASALHASNIFDILAVGVDRADLAELQAIASRPEFVFITNYFNNVGLQQLQEEILPQLCVGM